MTSRARRGATSNEERFQMLVDHPYGLAAVERNANVQLMLLYVDKETPRYAWYNELARIFHQVSEARAKARWRA